MKKIKRLAIYPEQSQLVKYYFLYKNLVEYHKEIGFGEAPRSSEGLTEYLCCHLLKLERATKVKRKHDLKDTLNNLDVEVKATVSENGTTSINPISPFHYLLWVRIDTKNDRLVIKKIPYTEFKSFFAPYVDVKSTFKKQPRTSITLKNFEPSEEWIYKFQKNSDSIVCV